METIAQIIPPPKTTDAGITNDKSNGIFLWIAIFAIIVMALGSQIKLDPPLATTAFEEIIKSISRVGALCSCSASGLLGLGLYLYLRFRKPPVKTTPA